MDGFLSEIGYVNLKVERFTVNAILEAYIVYRVNRALYLGKMFHAKIRNGKLSRAAYLLFYMFLRYVYF